MVNRDLQWVVEPGEFDLWIGGSSDATATTVLTVEPPKERTIGSALQ
jgi:hypothetical protein